MFQMNQAVRYVVTLVLQRQKCFAVQNGLNQRQDEKPAIIAANLQESSVALIQVQ